MTEREKIAREIYRAMTWAANNSCTDRHPEWENGGNSLAQDEARACADRVAAIPPPAAEAIEEAFLRLCEALGIPATAGAYLEVSRLASPTPMREEAWLIEHGGMKRAMYWTGVWDRWSDDHKEACRFARRYDAHKVSLGLGEKPNDPPHKIVEHKWISL